MALTIQVELDDIRHWIASAFMIAFPAVFKKEDMIVIYGATSQKEKLIWSVFQRKLIEHFLSYHRVKKGYDNTWALHTCHSCFDDIECSAGFVGASNNTSDADSRGPEETYVARCDERGRVDESEEDFFKRIFKFFYPVLNSRRAQSKEHLDHINELLDGWRKDLDSNIGASLDARGRYATINTSDPRIQLEGHDGIDTRLGPIHGQDTSGARTRATRVEDDSDDRPGATNEQDNSGSRPGTSHGQDTSSARTRITRVEDDSAARPKVRSQHLSFIILPRHCKSMKFLSCIVF